MNLFFQSKATDSPPDEWMTAWQAERYRSPAPASPGEAGDRNTQERSSKPRFLHCFQMKKAGLAAGDSSSRESG
jgi:hypothetical protein